MIGPGELIAESSAAEFIRQALGCRRQSVRSQPEQFSEILTEARAVVGREDAEALSISGPDSAAIGEPPAQNGGVPHELSPRAGSLEESFRQLTGDAVEYHTQSAAG
jgi:ABC-2 type transport system ATP-binding protein